MSRNWLSVQDEDRLLDEVAQRRVRLTATRLSVTPQMGRLAGSYADAYPWMDLGAIQALSQAGIPADSPQAVSIADLAARQAAEDGQFDTPAEDVPDAWYETLWHAATDWAKPIVRTGFTALSMPFEELQALLSAAGTALFDETEPGMLAPLEALAELGDPGQLISDFWTNYTEKAARSSGVLALSDLLAGKHVDLGQGFLPGGKIWEEREAAKHRLQLDGQFVTPGRVFARQFTEPGTGAYQMLSGAMDFVQNIALDPTVYAFAGLSKAQKAHRAFQTVGLIPGTRKTVAVEKGVDFFVNSPDGQRLVNMWTENRDVFAAWKSLGSPDAGGMGMEAARKLAATDNATDTVRVLTGLGDDELPGILGTVVRERPSIRFTRRQLEGSGRNEFGTLIGHGSRAARADDSRLGFLVRRGRLGENLPTGPINARNVDNAAVQLDRWMVNAQLSEATRAQIIGELSGVTGQATFEGVVETGAKAVANVLEDAWGVSESRARDLTRLFGDVQDGHRVFDLDELGGHLDVLKPLRPVIDGAPVDLSPMPAMIAELADDIYLPNVREIRRLTPIVKELQGLYDSGLWKGTVDGIRAFQSAAWMPLNILRNALTSRVVGDGQTRIAGAGYDSFINHPMDAIDWMLAHDPKSAHWQRFQKLLTSDKIPVSLRPKARGVETLGGQGWDDFTWLTNSMERGSGGWLGLPGQVLTGNYVKVKYGQPGFYEGWADKLSHMANDPVYRRVAGGLTPGDLRSAGNTVPGDHFDDVFDWFWRGTGQTWRKELGSIEGRSKLLTDPQAAREYLRQNFFDNLKHVTGGDPDLVQFVAKGRLGKVNARASGHTGGLSKTLQESYDHAAPTWTGTPQSVSAGRRNQMAEAFNHLTEVGFEKILTDPENYLTKSPTFRQMYFQRVEEVIGFAPRKLQEDMIRRAGEVGMDDSYLAKLAAIVNRGEGTRLKSMRQVDMLAGSWAMSETKKLLYNLADRNQFMDMFKVIFPFGDVWKNVMTSWGGIIRQNPSVLRRFQQGLEGARQPSLLGEAETEPGTGEGFFHPDPSTGEEVFTYPLLGKLTTGMLGLPEGSVEFTGRAAGLNLVTSTVLPGFGPAVTIPASHLIPNTPKWDTVRDVLLPFGPTESLVDQLTPRWAQQLKQFFSEPNPETHRLFANTVTDVMRALAPTGKHDLTTPEGQQALLDQATTIAKNLYVIRGIAQFNLPTGPALQWNAEDVQGNLVPVKLLADDLRRLTEEMGGDRTAAFGEWVKRYGVENVLAVIPKTTSITERPVTEKGDAWMRANSDLERDFPATIGLFAPEEAVGEFDYSAYLRAIETGAREGVSPAEQLALANDFLGRVQFEQAKKIAALHPGPVGSMFLTQVRQQIAEEYPGFDGWVSRAIWEKKPKPDELIAELRSAIQNPTLANTDAGRGILKYLSAIDVANQMVQQLPGNTRHYQQAKSAAPIRFWLRMVARDIREQHPDFARSWNLVFERELADDDQPALVPAA